MQILHAGKSRSAKSSMALQSCVGEEKVQYYVGAMLLCAAAVWEQRREPEGVCSVQGLQSRGDE